MNKLGITQNISFYHQEAYKRGRKDVIFELTWCRHIRKEFFDNLQTSKKLTVSEGIEEDSKDSGINLIDCLSEFEKPELLDEDNKWYCSDCKVHV